MAPPESAAATAVTAATPSPGRRRRRKAGRTGLPRESLGGTHVRPTSVPSTGIERAERPAPIIARRPARPDNHAPDDPRKSSPTPPDRAGPSGRHRTATWSRQRRPPPARGGRLTAGCRVRLAPADPLAALSPYRVGPKRAAGILGREHRATAAGRRPPAPISSQQRAFWAADAPPVRPRPGTARRREGGSVGWWAAGSLDFRVEARR